MGNCTDSCENGGENYRELAEQRFSSQLEISRLLNRCSSSSVTVLGEALALANERISKYRRAHEERVEPGSRLYTSVICEEIWLLNTLEGVRDSVRKVLVRADKEKAQAERDERRMRRRRVIYKNPKRESPEEEEEEMTKKRDSGKRIIFRSKKKGRKSMLIRKIAKKEEVAEGVEGRVKKFESKVE